MHMIMHSHTLLKMLLLALMYCFFSFDAASASDGFLGPTGAACACPGSPVQYLCTVNDSATGGFSQTIWRGTAFDCTAAGITLAHTGYSTMTQGACDNGNFTLTAQGLANVTGNCYTSVLTVNVEPGLNGRTVECTFAGTTIVGSSTLQVAVPLPPPSTPQVVVPVPDQSFTVSWAPPTAECGNAVTYTYLSSLDGSCGECTNNMTSESSVTCREWTAQGPSCSITARADNCAGMGSESQPVVIRFPRPAAPSITGGEVVFDQSRGSATITVQWDPVVPTDAIAVSGVAVLVDGAITDYLVNFTTGQGVPVEVTCSNTSCASPELPTDPDGGASFFIRVLARNAITEGVAGQALCSNFQVERSIGSLLLDVTLTCPVADCTIRYGLDPTYQTLPSEGRSGEPLQNLTAGETYYTEATFTCGGLTVRVQDTFVTCECPSSGLFAGAVTEAATCPQEFTGGVRTTSSNGIACYSGLTIDSTAEFVCDDVTQECSGSCGSMCMCGSGLTRAEWNVTFASTSCITPLGLSTGTIVGIVIGAIVALLLLAAIVALGVWLFYCRPDSDSFTPSHAGSPKKSKRNKKLTDEEHELREPSPITHDPNALYSNPTDIRHEAAPESHDEYAMLDIHTKKKPKPASKAKESSELQKQVGPEGDVYTVPVPKRGSSKRKQESPPPSLPPPSEEQLAEMYATPDMTQKSRNKNTAAALVYADIGVLGPSRPAPVPTAGQVTYSTITGTKPGPVEEVIEPTYAN